MPTDMDLRRISGLAKAIEDFAWEVDATLAGAIQRAYNSVDQSMRIRA
jgi:hypothetical protein